VAGSGALAGSASFVYTEIGGVTMDQFIPFISEVGFPIIVTLYLLHRIEAKLDTVVFSIQNLAPMVKDRTVQ
jgi:hypothetical protein